MKYLFCLSIYMTGRIFDFHIPLINDFYGIKKGGGKLPTGKFTAAFFASNFPIFTGKTPSNCTVSNVV